MNTPKIEVIDTEMIFRHRLVCGEAKGVWRRHGEASSMLCNEGEFFCFVGQAPYPLLEGVIYKKQVVSRDEVRYSPETEEECRRIMES